jgi:hypothetical protein
LAISFVLHLAAGFDVQPIVPNLHSIPAVLSGAAHLRKHARRLLAPLSGTWRPASARRRRTAAPAAPVPRLAPGRQWEIVVDLAARELARAPRIAALHAHAALKIDAAEHAFGRIVADCAKVCAAPLAPVPQPALNLVPPAEAPQRRPLAA